MFHSVTTKNSTKCASTSHYGNYRQLNTTYHDSYVATLKISGITMKQNLHVSGERNGTQRRIHDPYTAGITVCEKTILRPKSDIKQ